MNIQDCLNILNERQDTEKSPQCPCQHHVLRKPILPNAEIPSSELLNSYSDLELLNLLIKLQGERVQVSKSILINSIN